METSFFLVAAWLAAVGVEPVAPVVASTPAPQFCATSYGPDYYAFPLAATQNIPGTGYARGRAEISVPVTSPFPVAVGLDGSYLYQVDVSIDNMRAPRYGQLVAWVTTSDLERIERIGTLDERMRASGPVSWNKFLVVITLEDSDAAGDEVGAEMWTGPIVFRGMSRSGAMHTMLGHGALQQENCTSYGFGA